MKAIRVLLSFLLAVAAVGTSLVKSPAPLPGERLLNTSLGSRAADRDSGPASSSGVSELTREQVMATYGKLPLSFVANQGQTSRPATFMSQTSSYALYVSSTDAVLTLRKPAPELRENAARHPAPRPVPSRSSAAHVNSRVVEPKRAVLRLTLVGANAQAQMTAAEELPGRVNYLHGKDPARWRTNVPTYAKVRMGNVYPGVDLVYYGNQSQLEHDFVLGPGIDPKVIVLQVEGSKPEVGADGALVLPTEAGQVRMLAPRAYQEVNGVKRLVASQYVERGNGRVGFEVSAHDPSRALVIDPVLVFSTFLGGSNHENDDNFPSIAVDSEGNVYLAGETDSSDFPTQNPFQPAHGAFTFGDSDVVVTKFNPTGSALIYSTYMGGNSEDAATGIAVDRAGHAFVTGFTSSTDFPVKPGSFQTTFGGGKPPGNQFSGDAFVTKLSVDGSAQIYSTYVGGDDTDFASGIAVDADGNAYVTGGTNSANFPVTAGAFQTTFGGAGAFGIGDAFVAKLNAAGSALIYSTFIGGSDDESAAGIALDARGNAYVTGSTVSTDFPVTAAAFRTTFGGSGPFAIGDAFVTKLNAAGSALAYSTYLGGALDDFAAAIAVDRAGHAYVTGCTLSTDFPVTRQAFQKTFAGGTGTDTGGCGDAFVTKLNGQGSALVYSTYLGGSNDDEATSIALDRANRAYITGLTSSTNFPVTPDAIQGAFAGGSPPFDAFVTVLASNGSKLGFSTYLGGSGYEDGDDIAVDRHGNIYVVGTTISSDFPVTAGAFDATCGTDGTCNGGAYDMFVLKIARTPSLAAVPPGLAFASQAVSTTSPPKIVNVSNQGNAAVTIGGVVTRGDFVQTNTCGAAVPGHTNCAIAVTFTPTATGARSGTVTLTDGAGHIVKVIVLTGTGT